MPPHGREDARIACLRRQLGRLLCIAGPATGGPPTSDLIAWKLFLWTAHGSPAARRRLPAVRESLCLTFDYQFPFGTTAVRDSKDGWQLALSLSTVARVFARKKNERYFKSSRFLPTHTVAISVPASDLQYAWAVRRVLRSAIDWIAARWSPRAASPIASWIRVVSARPPSAADMLSDHKTLSRLFSPTAVSSGHAL